VHRSFAVSENCEIVYLDGWAAPKFRGKRKQSAARYFTSIVGLHRSFAVSENVSATKTLPRRCYCAGRLYPRATPGIIRLIVPKHIHLSKAFQGWLRAQHAIESRREVQQIDMEFMVGSERAMAEFKIAYNQKTKPAVLTLLVYPIGDTLA
jgi:hypothetical protein